VAERASGKKTEHVDIGDGAAVDLRGGRPAEIQSPRGEQRRPKRTNVLGRYILSAGGFIQSRDRKPAYRHTIDRASIQGVADKQKRRFGNAMVDVSLVETIVGRLRERIRRLSRAAAQRSPLGKREKAAEV